MESKTDKNRAKRGSRNSGDLRIRAAGAEDIPLLLMFIKRLAHYEKLSHEVTATEEILRTNLFGERRGTEVILAEVRDTAVGFALYFHNFSTFLGKPGIYIEDLFVDENYRGRGFGYALFAHIAALAKQRGCGRLEWSVLDWNRPAIRFYENLGAAPLSDWTTYRLTGQALDQLGKSGMR